MSFGFGATGTPAKVAAHAKAKAQEAAAGRSNAEAQVILACGQVVEQAAALIDHPITYSASGHFGQMNGREGYFSVKVERAQLAE